MNLVYITFGDRIDHHLQASFSIYSFLCRKESFTSITVLTNSPAFYEHLKNDVQVIWVNQDQLADWKGPHDFFWRVKIKALELMASQYAGQPVMYLDTDTFLYVDPVLLKTQLENGHALMHEKEAALSRYKSKTTSKMWSQVKNRSYSGVAVDESSSMWNAGVVASPNTLGNQEFITAVEICDAMCAAGVTRRLIEQFALSLSLQHFYGLEPAAGAIAHYWSNKEDWNRAITEVIAAAYFKNFTTSEVLSDIRKFDFHRIPIVKKQKNTRERLDRLVSRLFPPREIKFVK